MKNRYFLMTLDSKLLYRTQNQFHYISIEATTTIFPGQHNESQCKTDGRALMTTLEADVQVDFAAV